MIPTSLFSSLLLLALGVAANSVVVNHSPVTLPMVRKLNRTNGTHDLLRHDRARARAFRSPASERSSVAATGINQPVMNEVFSYVASVGVGSPATYYDLIVDTGSSNTWIGAGKRYVRTRTSSLALEIVHVTYGSGSFLGIECNDTVTLTSNLVIPAQSIGVALLSNGFDNDGVDGILGIGPVGLTTGTLIPDTSSIIPTVTDNLFKQGAIPAKEIAVSFTPTTNVSDASGEITWGGTDPSKFTGSINYTSTTTTSPANEFWGINQSIHYGTKTILSSKAGIVDTGTTLILIATDAFDLYQNATGAVMDEATGLLRITTAQYKNLKNLDFIIGGVTYALTPNGQIWPRSLNQAIGGVAGKIYLIVADIGSFSGSGLDFINGYAFLERFYSVYDTTNKRVGLATTPFTNATTN